VKVPRCPRCRAEAVKLVEMWEGMTITFFPDDGFKDGTLNHDGFPVRVDGVCAQEHRWRLRGVRTIDDVTQPHATPVPAAR
jgi:hypothetical protein